MSKISLIAILLMIFAVVGCAESTAQIEADIRRLEVQNAELQNRVSTAEAVPPTPTRVPTVTPPDFVVVAKGSEDFNEFFVEYITGDSYDLLGWRDENLQRFRWQAIDFNPPECFVDATVGKPLPVSCK